MTNKTNIPKELRTGVPKNMYHSLAQLCNLADNVVSLASFASDVKDGALIAASVVNPGFGLVYLAMQGQVKEIAKEVAGDVASMGLQVGTVAAGSAAEKKTLEMLGLAENIGTHRIIDTTNGAWNIYTNQNATDEDELGFCATYKGEGQIPQTIITGPLTNDKTIDQVLDTLTTKVLEPKGTIGTWPVRYLNEEEGDIHGKKRGRAYVGGAIGLGLTDLTASLSSSYDGVIVSANEIFSQVVPDSAENLAYVALLVAGAFGTRKFLKGMRKRSKRLGLERDLEIATSLPNEAQNFDYGIAASRNMVDATTGIGNKMKDMYGSATGAVADSFNVVKNGTVNTYSKAKNGVTGSASRLKDRLPFKRFRSKE